MSAGSQIKAVDYNSLQDRVQLILGSGVGNRGYGQILQSADVFTGNNISADQWNKLRDDILSIGVHQNGVAPFAPTFTRGNPIPYANIPVYDSLITNLDNNRLNIASGQSIITTKGTVTTTTPWSLQAQTILTVTFNNSDEGRYFFNSGGKIRLFGSRSGGSSTSQNNAWTNGLASIGTLSFGATGHPTINYYNLTNAYQIINQTTASLYYGNNYFRLEVRSDVANNSNGTATQVQFRITLRDEYVDAGPPPPGDQINGTLSFVATELKAAGALYPSGTWNIVSPTYSFSAFTLS